MNTAIIPVQFNGDTLALVNHDGQPFVPMKPVVENIGLDWKSQHAKLVTKFSSTMVEITTVAEDGKNRSMFCLPLRKIPAWLYSINPEKVSPDLREKVIQYQEECDEVLWQYWTQGQAQRPGAGGKAGSISQQMSASRELSRLLKELKRETHPSLREALKRQAAHVSEVMGVPVPEMDSIGRSREPSQHGPELVAFWDAVQKIGEEALNHSPQRGYVAINLSQFFEMATEAGIELPQRNKVMRELRSSLDPRFVEANRAVRSPITEKTHRCWVFKRDYDT